MVRVKEDERTCTRDFARVVDSAVPVCRGFGRPSPYLCGKGRNIVYSYIGREVSALYEAWNRHTAHRRRTPMVNRQWVDAWLERMHMDKDETISRLGVADPLDNIAIGISRQGGRRITIHTFEEEYGRLFARRRAEDSARWLTTADGLLQSLTDVSVFTALARLNRMAMYYAVADAAGWSRELTASHMLTTLTCGLCTDTWQVLCGEVYAPEGLPFLLPADTDSWLICQAPKGEANSPFPWRVVHTDEYMPPIGRNVVRSVVSVTALPPESHWTAECAEERVFL